MFHIRLSGEKPEPKPYYYDRMNPQELFIWQVIGEQKYEWVRDSKGKLHKRRLTAKDRAIQQRMFYDTRVGHGVCGDDWMRKKLPCRRAP
ncbi:hypothetical protein BDU57DRAFT_558210 [Ampelomyces quisqualis]|uniref:Uncharacterized protein n=1 Tax=Ampelomyces quisqualis TaxID=50730 RepID=A0A6A5QGX6_AMPQU|nr:hypothetical protein BDU57DRAFT_558210 [Ampelomyces quisqualis]